MTEQNPGMIVLTLDPPYPELHYRITSTKGYNLEWTYPHLLSLGDRYTS